MRIIADFDFMSFRNGVYGTNIATPVVKRALGHPVGCSKKTVPKRPGLARNLPMNDASELNGDPRAWLAGVLSEFSCQTGTLHRADGEWLDLVAQVGVPEELMPKIARIPFGKGIAGVAAERREPVELCNLQQDLGGVAKEDARKTQVSGSIAVPILGPDGRVLGTLGIGKYAPYDFPEAEKARIAEIAAGVAAAWA
jgi:putative methionine-R-sulfoxide reductase with GAF domain